VWAARINGMLKKALGRRGQTEGEGVLLPVVYQGKNIQVGEVAPAPESAIGLLGSGSARIRHGGAAASGKVEQVDSIAARPTDDLVLGGIVRETGIIRGLKARAAGGLSAEFRKAWRACGQVIGAGKAAADDHELVALGIQDAGGVRGDAIGVVVQKLGHCVGVGIESGENIVV